MEGSLPQEVDLCQWKVRQLQGDIRISQRVEEPLSETDDP